MVVEHRALCAPDETLSDHRVCKSPQHRFNLTEETEGLVLMANLLLFPAVQTLFLFFPSLFPWIALCSQFRQQSELSQAAVPPCLWKQMDFRAFARKIYPN